MSSSSGHLPLVAANSSGGLPTLRKTTPASPPLWRFSTFFLWLLVFLVIFVVAVFLLALRAAQPPSTAKQPVRLRPDVSDDDRQLLVAGGDGAAPPATVVAVAQQPEFDELKREIGALQMDLRRQQEDVARQKAQIMSQLDRRTIERQREIEARRESVRQGFLFGWNNYKQFAWGADELDPLARRGKDWLGLAATIVDSLDTLWIMDLKDEFKLARDYVDKKLNFDTRKQVSVFETCIRDLGGLCAAYEFSRDRMFLEKAEDLAYRLLKAFDTPSGLPRASVDLHSGQSQNPSWTGGASILSEMGTMQLEFTYLAYHLGKPELAAKVNQVFKHLDRLGKPNKGLYPLYVNVQDGSFRGSQVSLGALGDSFYEYLIKMWVFTGKRLPGLRRMYDECSDGINEKLVFTSSPSSLRYVAELNMGGAPHHKMDELACFVGGMFALGAASQPSNTRAQRDLRLGADLAETCYQFWHRMPTGIAPELVTWHSGADFQPGMNAKHYLLRPETVETLFVLWRTTGDPKYQDWGWEIWQSIDRYCKTPTGYAGIRDVTNTNTGHDDTQQSFFFAETLKYLYLLFSPNDLIPLDKYVFNTEAHPLGIIDNYEWPSSYTDYLP